MLFAYSVDKFLIVMFFPLTGEKIKQPFLIYNYIISEKNYVKLSERNAHHIFRGKER